MRRGLHLNFVSIGMIRDAVWLQHWLKPVISSYFPQPDSHNISQHQHQGCCATVNAMSYLSKGIFWFLVSHYIITIVVNSPVRGRLPCLPGFQLQRNDTLLSAECLPGMFFLACSAKRRWVISPTSQKTGGQFTGAQAKNLQKPMAFCRSLKSIHGSYLILRGRDVPKSSPQLHRTCPRNVHFPWSPLGMSPMAATWTFTSAWPLDCHPFSDPSNQRPEGRCVKLPMLPRWVSRTREHTRRSAKWCWTLGHDFWIFRNTSFFAVSTCSRGEDARMFHHSPRNLVPKSSGKSS